MWIINHPKRQPITSKNYGKKAPDQPLKFNFYIKSDIGDIVAKGQSSDWMDPAPFWLAGLKMGGTTLWYMNPNSFEYEPYVSHRERGL